MPNEMPMIITANDSDVLYQLFPNPNLGVEIKLSDEANMLIERIQSLSQDNIQIEEQIKKSKNELKVMLGDNELGKSDLWKVSWKLQQTKRLDTKLIKEEQPELYNQYANVTSSRVLRYSQINKEK